MSHRTWKIIKWGTGFLSLYLDWRLRRLGRRRAPDIVLTDWVMARLIPKPRLEPFTEVERRRYLATTNQLLYWHGTGRLQYDKRGQLVDVLELILKQGGMRPFEDTFDIKQGAMFSTSVARQRMYARIYADMHESGGANLRERYGSPRFWAYYFIMAINLHAIRELGLWSARQRRRQQDAWRKQGEEIWAIKVSQHPVKATGKFFDNGSDIAGNFPILIGLGPADYTMVKTADYVARYERRIGSNIPVAVFTHLEVPKNRQTEVQKLLKKYGCSRLPVFAFEQCERLHADMSFSALVSRPK